VVPPLGGRHEADVSAESRISLDLRVRCSGRDDKDCDAQLVITSLPVFLEGGAIHLDPVSEQEISQGVRHMNWQVLAGYYFCPDCRR
jgi:hypothetical protein